MKGVLIVTMLLVMLIPGSENTDLERSRTRASSYCLPIPLSDAR